MKLNRQPEPNDLSARFSLPYAVATAAILRQTGPDAFSFRADAAELAKRVDVRTATDLEASWPECSPARVTVHWAGGSATAEVPNPHGHHSQPITEAELRSKFMELMKDPNNADLWWGKLTNLTDVSDCSLLFQSSGQ